MKTKKSEKKTKITKQTHVGDRKNNTKRKKIIIKPLTIEKTTTMKTCSC